MFWPLLVHYCDTCHYNTTVDYTPTVWKQDHACNHCGISAPGADLAGSSPVEMNQGQHDELAQMFAQAMRVTPGEHVQQQQPQQQQSHQQQAYQQEQHGQYSQQQQQAVPHLLTPAPPPEKQNATPVHFVSSHYYPSATHIRPDTTSPPSRSPPPPYHEALMPDAMASVLRDHAIDPAALLPNQVHLFQNADEEQRRRLLELWRIAPPGYDNNEPGTWVTTSVEREEVLAKMRWEERQQQEQEAQRRQEEQQQQEQQQQQRRWHEEHMLDTHIPPSHDADLDLDGTTTPISPIREPGDVPWPPAARMRASFIASSHSRSTSTANINAEPYILSGYNSTTENNSATSRGALDPVYAAAAGAWEAPSYSVAVEEQLRVQREEEMRVRERERAVELERERQRQAVVVGGMENQYGMYEQVRNHRDWERVNEGFAREGMARAGTGGQAEDWDMEM